MHFESRRHTLEGPEGNKIVGRKKEVSCIIIPSINVTSFHHLSIVYFLNKNSIHLQYMRNMRITHCHHYVLHLPEAESNANQKLCISQYSPKGQPCCLLIWTSSRHQLSNGSDRVRSEGVPDLQQSEKLASTLRGI